MAPPNKQIFNAKILARLCDILFYSWTMYKLKIKLLYNNEKPFCTKKELLNFKFTLPLAELDIAGPRSMSNGLIFSDHIPVDIPFRNFFIAI